MVEGYISMRQANSTEKERTILSNYMYQLVMHASTSETAIMILFSQGLQSFLPLGSAERLANPNLSFPVSYVFGDTDWMRHCEDDFSK